MLITFQTKQGYLEYRITKKRRENLATLKESTSTFYLYRSALVRERTTEEGRDNVHNTVGDIGLQCNILVGSHQNYFGHIGQETPLEQGPHVVRGVDFFHFYFGVYVAVVEEIDVRFLYLKQALEFSTSSFIATFPNFILGRRYPPISYLFTPLYLKPLPFSLKSS